MEAYPDYIPLSGGGPEAIIEIDGVEQCLKDLKRVRYDISKRAVGRSLRAGALIYEAEMRLRVPYGHTYYRYPGRKSPVTPYKYTYRGKRSKRIGTTRRALQVRTYQDPEGPTVLIRISRGPKTSWDAFYAMFVLQGTKKQKHMIRQPNKWAYSAARAAKPRAMPAVADRLKEECVALGLQPGE